MLPKKLTDLFQSIIGVCVDLFHVSISLTFFVQVYHVIVFYMYHVNGLVLVQKVDFLLGAVCSCDSPIVGNEGGPTDGMWAQQRLSCLCSICSVFIRVHQVRCPRPIICKPQNTGIINEFVNRFMSLT